MSTPASIELTVSAMIQAELEEQPTRTNRQNPIPRYMVQNICMRIGELAARAEVNIQTLRFYEREGLLRPPARTASGYRSYMESDLERVRFIRLCQALGFTLRDVQQLLVLHKSVAEYRGAVKMKPSAVREIVTMANERLEVIDEKLAALNSMRAELTSLVSALNDDSDGMCPVAASPANKSKK